MSHIVLGRRRYPVYVVQYCGVLLHGCPVRSQATWSTSSQCGTASAGQAAQCTRDVVAVPSHSRLCIPRPTVGLRRTEAVCTPLCARSSAVGRLSAGGFCAGAGSSGMHGEAPVAVGEGGSYHRPRMRCIDLSVITSFYFTFADRLRGVVDAGHAGCGAGLNAFGMHAANIERKSQ